MEPLVITFVVHNPSDRAAHQRQSLGFRSWLTAPQLMRERVREHGVRAGQIQGLVDLMRLWQSVGPSTPPPRHQLSRRTMGPTK